ncbi:MAG: response regulator transcription factor [Actinomycetota bacterium]
MSARILVAEDDPKQADVIRRYLEREGHAVVVVGDGRSAVDEARRRRPDLVLLDVMMPELDGFDVCRVLRFETNIPVVFLTARATEEDLLLGLDLGADDYLRKPFSPRELVARVRVVLRRVGVAGEVEEVHRHGALEVDRRRARVRLADEVVEVTPKEFAVLAALAADPGRAFSRRQIIEDAFGFDAEVLERTVDVHVANLRRKIEVDPSRPEHLLTVKGIGYAFAEDG